MNNKQVQTTETLYVPRMTAELIKIITHAFALSPGLTVQEKYPSQKRESTVCTPKNNHVNL